MRGTGPEVEPRPVQDQIAGLDDVLVEAAAGRALEVPWQHVRVAVASAQRRHDELLGRLDGGEDPVWLVADGVIAWWSTQIDHDGGWVRHGAEIEAVCAAVLAEIGAQEVLAGVVVARPAVEAAEESLARAVVLEWFDGFVLAQLA